MPKATTICAAAGAAAALYYALRRRKAAGAPSLATPDAPKDETADARDARLRAKFAPKTGLTFYFFPRSPCARRVWLTLLEKGIKHHAVVVNLLAGEQRS